ncbi:membrane protein [Skermanella stibiiresistens SB22]|uniref:Membrane protein n=1 Tax=Skermanella stibiiresistens SB22 TaxID=1385369 RepID=W9H3M4_9PROT|nr:hypothetical protein [Skermanella stibiiresistens]EWY38373.1 membrane protein [Skermanella stibiiresistens SB22]
MSERKRRFLTGALSLYIAFVFIQSLFFKFTDSPETRHIFGTLDAWAAGWGFPGLFAPTGPFSQYVVGTGELVASLLLLAGLLTGRVALQGAGAALALGVISGAIFFHLFTPLGIQVLNTDGSLDGGELFALACGVWIASAGILVLRRSALMALTPLGSPRSRARVGRS